MSFRKGKPHCALIGTAVVVIAAAVAAGGEAALFRLVSGRAVRCEARYKDSYGQTVARCFTGGVDLGGEMVRQGWALDYERYSKGRYRQDQAEAKDEGRGLWSGTFALPWE